MKGKITIFAGLAGFSVFLIFEAFSKKGPDIEKSPEQQIPITSQGILSRSEPQIADSADQVSPHHLNACCIQLAQAKDRAAALALLGDLRDLLEELSPEEAHHFVASYFASDKDALLPLPFQIAKGGQLETAPTIRTALLDHLGKVNPKAAEQLSKDLLTTPTHPDEWALALRNVARIPDSDHDFLRYKTEELIQNPTWQAKPSIGYLNAFDVLAYTRSTESTPLLANLVKNKDRQDLAHASFLTLSLIHI